MAGDFNDNTMDGMNDDDLHFSDADFDALLAGGSQSLGAVHILIFETTSFPSFHVNNP